MNQSLVVLCCSLSSVLHGFSKLVRKQSLIFIKQIYEIFSSGRSTYLRPLDRNETACLQKGYKPIRLIYTEQPLTARILVDGSKVCINILLIKIEFLLFE